MYTKLFTFIIFLFLQIAMFSQQQVTVFVSYTNSYCNGARPTTEILTKYNTPAKLSNFKIKLVGKKNMAVVTDTAGCFIHKLHPGKYQVFLTEENNKNLYTNYDPTCVKMLKTSFGELLIKKGQNTYKINLHFSCNPCEPSDKP